MTNTAITLSNEQAEAVKAFAKSRKLSSAALIEAATIALQMLPQQAPRATRQAGAASIAFREQVEQKYDEVLKGNKLTIADVAKLFGLDPANTTNNLKWLKEHGKINFKEVGKAEKPAGVRGRAATIFEFA